MSTLTEEAASIVSGARNTAYGAPEDNFARIARLWTAHLANLGFTVELHPHDVAAMMRLMKEARLANDPSHRDSLVDIIGYTLCHARTVGVE